MRFSIVLFTLSCFAAGGASASPAREALALSRRGDGAVLYLPPDDEGGACEPLLFTGGLATPLVAGGAEVHGAAFLDERERAFVYLSRGAEALEVIWSSGERCKVTASTKPGAWRRLDRCRPKELLGAGRGPPWGGSQEAPRPYGQVGVVVGREGHSWRGLGVPASEPPSYSSEPSDPRTQLTERRHREARLGGLGSFGRAPSDDVVYAVPPATLAFFGTTDAAWGALSPGVAVLERPLPRCLWPRTLADQLPPTTSPEAAERALLAHPDVEQLIIAWRWRLPDAWPIAAFHDGTRWLVVAGPTPSDLSRLDEQRRDASSATERRAVAERSAALSSLKVFELATLDERLRPTAEGRLLLVSGPLPAAWPGIDRFTRGAPGPGGE